MFDPTQILSVTNKSFKDPDVISDSRYHVIRMYEEIRSGESMGNVRPMDRVPCVRGKTENKQANTPQTTTLSSSCYPDSAHGFLQPCSYGSATTRPPEQIPGEQRSCLFYRCLLNSSTQDHASDIEVLN